jgi:hypothetical protein
VVSETHIDLGGENSRRQELGVILAGDLTGEVLGRELELVALWRFGAELIGLLVEQLERIRLVHLLALSRRDAVAAPLPELAPTDLGSRSILL